MKIKKTVLAILLVLVAVPTLTACPGDKPTAPDNGPVATVPDGEDDCDLGDVVSLDEDCVEGT
jgi:hypothetical protein